MSTFDTCLKPNFKNFNRPAISNKLREPTVVGLFSIDQNRQFSSDYSNCKYLKLPPKDQPISFDLNDGYEFVQRRPESANEEKIDHVLKCILSKLSRLARTRNNETKFLHADVICYRDTLRMLMCTPYEYREGWSLLATKWKGSIYLCGFETEEGKAKRLSESEESKKLLSYGYKFKQYILSESPSADPITNIPVNESEEFCAMFCSGIDDTKLIYCAELHGIHSATVQDLSSVKLNDLKFTELKVQPKSPTRRHMNNFYRFKTRKWWSQLYLTKVRRIVLGLRSDSGIVDEVTFVDLKYLQKDYEEYWNTKVCVEFLSEFIIMVKHQMDDINCPHTVYKFDYDPKKYATVQCTPFEGWNSLTFLPQWYIDEIIKAEAQNRPETPDPLLG